MLVRGRSGGIRCCACTCALVFYQYPVGVSKHSTARGSGLTFCFGRPGWYVTDWKLNGLRALSVPLIEGTSVSVPLMMLAGVYGNVALAGVYSVGVARCETESLGPRVANCLDGKVADIGESALGSNPRPPADSSPSNPRPTGGCGTFSSGGGVGVRGGSGIPFEAMTAAQCATAGRAVDSATTHAAGDSQIREPDRPQTEGGGEIGGCLPHAD